MEDEGTDWGDASTRQDVPKIASKPPEARGGAWKFLPQGQGTDTVYTNLRILT